MNNITSLLIRAFMILLFSLLLNLQVEQALGAVFPAASFPSLITGFRIFDLSLVLVSLMSFFYYFNNRLHAAKIHNYLAFAGVIYLITKAVLNVVMLLGLVASVLIVGMNWIISLFRSTSTPAAIAAVSPIFAAFALGLASFVFLSLLYGMLGGKYRYKMHRHDLYFEDLPADFEGFKLIQISDVHSGSLDSFEGVKKGIELINAEQADVILFTGDLVNNVAAEMKPWMELFASLQAKLGKYSILGNHDYGDYVRWESPELKRQNLMDLAKVHHEIGFRLLLNESLPLQQKQSEIQLVGVENWGKPPFPKYGDLNAAVSHLPSDGFKILMSHDPSHWEGEVLGHEHTFHLTLSGHTHGAQMGFEFLGLKWSPSKYVYKQWAGLYSKDNQHLYVNRGFGFLGYPGRIGIWPEITVLTLRRKVS